MSNLLHERLLAGDVRALARAISVVEDGADGAAPLLAACVAGGRRAWRIGVTGPPGAGKSTLVDQLVRVLRRQGRTVAVLAVDPSSMRTGGAFLGDRIRMQGFERDPGVYFRSVATRGAVGGLGQASVSVCCLLEAAGWEVLVIETVGVGQDEIAVASLADVTALVLGPEMGDDVQALKAGIMEIADVYVINKADLAGADRAVEQIPAAEALVCEGGASRPVLTTIATTGAGVAELIDALAAETRKAPKAAEREPGVRIDHLGVAVRQIEAARGFYELLGLRVEPVETVEHEGVRSAMISAGSSRIELLEPLGEDTVIGRYLARRGEGLHHVALRVEGIDARFRDLAAAGVRLASDGVATGAGGHRYFFVHPSSAGGVLIELVEAPK